MTIQTWFYPSPCGDIRLVAEGEQQTRVIVIHPTPVEREVLIRLAAAAISRKWLSPGQDSGLLHANTTDEVQVVLNAPLHIVGSLFLGDRCPPKGVILGIKYADGKIDATLDGPAVGLALLGPDAPTEEVDPTKDPVVLAELADAGIKEYTDPGIRKSELVLAKEAKAAKTKADKEAKIKAVADAKAKADAEAAAKAPVKAVVVQRPTVCCPNPRQGPLDPASEVLREFTTPEQWAEWERDGMIHVKGGLTGDTYRVVHRKHPLAQQQGKCTFNESTGHIVHCHLTHLPPPEEALSILLTLQFGEDYLRNASAYFGPGRNFPHPLGRGAWDGLASAAFGRSMVGLIPGFVTGRAIAGGFNA